MGKSVRGGQEKPDTKMKEGDFPYSMFHPTMQTYLLVPSHKTLGDTVTATPKHHVTL